MQESLKTEIISLVETLKSSGKTGLAQAIEENWSKNCLEYSKEIKYTKKNIKPLEKIMVCSLEIEFTRLGYSKEKNAQIIKYLEKNRFLQTAPHISPALKPRYFFIDWLTSLSLTKKDFYPVAMFSGVPFSNKTRPGRLCSEKKEVNLMPSNMQDELVYRSIVPEKMIEVINDLPKEIQKILPKAKNGDSYTKWALASSKHLEQKFLNYNAIFFDFNEVIANYILEAIKDKEHPVSLILFSKKECNIVSKLFKNEIFFYGTSQKGKYKVMESFALKDGYLESATRKILLTQENITDEIKNNRLCPGLPLGFLIFSFLNNFVCAGSFAQTEYLPIYREKFNIIPSFKKYNIQNKSAGVLTTGSFPEDINLHPLDLYMGKKFKPNKKMLFGEAILAIKDVLLHQNYSNNMVK